MSSQTETCRCNLHQQLELRMLDAHRHASYRQLAFAILGPAAPRDDAALTRALADHARLLRPSSFTSLKAVKAA